MPERLRERFDEIAALRYWFGASMLVSSHLRIPLLEALWAALKAHERPEVFVTWFNPDDVPSQCYEFLVQALAGFKYSSQRIFDSQAARARFARLPDVVTIYRGGIEKEAADKRLGVCWNLSRDKAIETATRLLNSGAQAALMTAKVNRGAIVGLLVERAVDEVLIVPEDISLDQVEALHELSDVHAAVTPSVASAISSAVVSLLEATAPIVALPYRT